MDNAQFKSNSFIANDVYARDITFSISDDSRRYHQRIEDSSSYSKISNFKTLVRTIYHSLALPNVPWLDEGESFPISKYYVKLQLRNPEVIISLENLFDNIHGGPHTNSTRILIEGQPGYGKTTLCHKLVYDWAIGKTYIKHFQLAFLVLLRHLQGDTVKKMVNELVGGSDERDTWSLINNEKTLLVLDGLDELGKDERIDVLKILYQPMNKMAIVATSRTGQFRLSAEDKEKVFRGLSVKKQFHDKQITILGINDENRREFLSKFIQSEDKTMTLEHVQKISQSVTKMFDSPLLLILLAYVVSELGEINIENMTDLYKILCDCVIKRNASKQNKTKFVRDFSLLGNPSNQVTKDYIYLFIQFGKLSIEHLLHKNLQFSSNEVTDQIYAMGFFAKSTTITNFGLIHKYESFHLSVAEFSAAYTLLIDYKNNNDTFTLEVIKIISSVFYNLNSSCLVLPFLCGLLGKEMKNMFQSLSPYSILFSVNPSGIGYILEECKVDDTVSRVLSKFMLPILNAVFLATDVFSKDIEFGLKSNGLQHLQIYSSEMHVLRNGSRDISVWVKVTDKLSETVKVEKHLKCKRILFEFGNEVKNLQTIEKFLEICNSIRAEEKLLHIVNNSLQEKILHCLQKNVLKETTVTELYCKLTTCPVATEIIEHMIKINQLVGLRLKVECEQLLDNVLNIASQSDHLVNLNIAGNLSLDLSKFVQNENKQWRELIFNGIKITRATSCREKITVPCVSCIDYFEHNDVLLYSTIPNVLHCDGRYICDICHQMPHWDGWNSVRELTVILNNSSIELFPYLSRFKYLVTLAVDINIELINDSIIAIVKSEIIRRVRHLKLQWSEDGCKCGFELIRKLTDLIIKQKLDELFEFSVDISYYRFTLINEEFGSILKSLLRCVDCEKTVNIISNKANDFNRILHFFADIDMNNFLMFNFEHKTDKKFSTDFDFINHIIRISLK